MPFIKIALLGASFLKLIKNGVEVFYFNFFYLIKIQLEYYLVQFFMKLRIIQKEKALNFKALKLRLIIVYRFNLFTIKQLFLFRLTKYFSIY